MILKYAIIGLAMMSLGACATVDMSQIAGNAKPEQAAEPTAGPVSVAANSLKDTFAQNGWSGRQLIAPLKTMSHVLLRGRNLVTNGDSESYDMANPTVIEVKADITEAQTIVESTTATAKKYSDAAENVDQLRASARDLEKALIAARKAERTFESALDKLDVTNTDDLIAPLRNAVDGLRDVTNAYSDKVWESAFPVGAQASAS